MNTQQHVEKLMNFYFNAKTDAQKKRALEQIRKYVGDQSDKAVKMIESMNLEGDQNHATR